VEELHVYAPYISACNSERMVKICAELLYHKNKTGYPFFLDHPVSELYVCAAPAHFTVLAAQHSFFIELLKRLSYSSTKQSGNGLTFGRTFISLLTT